MDERSIDARESVGRWVGQKPSGCTFERIKHWSEGYLRKVGSTHRWISMLEVRRDFFLDVNLSSDRTLFSMITTVIWTMKNSKDVSAKHYFPSCHWIQQFSWTMLHITLQVLKLCRHQPLGKTVTQQWLTNHGLHWDANMPKAVSYEIEEQHRSRYVTKRTRKQRRMHTLCSDSHPTTVTSIPSEWYGHKSSNTQRQV